MNLARQSCHFLKKFLYVVLLTLLLYKNYFKTNSNFCQHFFRINFKYFLSYLRKVDISMFSTFDKIKELCQKQGISLNQLEDKLNFSTNYLYSMKKGNPKADNLQKIADYFNVSID